MKSLKYLSAILVIIIGSIYYIDAHFDNVLLIINYNHPHYESIPLLKKIYGPHFKNIVFYGPSKHPEVIEFHHYKGYFSYLCIADAMEKHPNHSGYLFLMDDCILNPYFIKEFDFKRICYAFCIEHQKSFPIDLKTGPPFDWCWWASQWGSKALKAALKKMPKKYRKILKENCGKDAIVGAFSDCAYIPSLYKKRFVKLAKIFGRYQVFLEISLPTILCSLSLKDEWIWLPGRSIYADPLKLFDKNAIFNHPVKLSIKQNRDFIKNFFNIKN